MSGPGRPEDRDRDRGLRAVRRVREVRERDGRIGFQLALAEQQERAARLEALHRHLEDAPVLQAGSPAAFLAAREAMLVLGAAVSGAEAELAPVRRIAESAREHWQRDSAALARVDSLLERRAEDRRHDAARAEGRRMDETGSQLWLRGRSEG